ncbi:ABC transporter permease [Pseudonocardia sp. GCM10023141]|uniref:ABC transporter permease n=1 Tax=Pseudonocardia sp. GCM10023141 TaxID=3252653 RepID=UPI00361A3C12
MTVVPAVSAACVHRRAWLRSGPHTGIAIATVALFALCAVLVPQSLTAQSIGAMLPAWGVLAIMAAGQTLVIQQRGIDLSVPGTVSLVAMGFTVFVDRNDVPVLVGIVVVLAVGAAVGLLNGLVTTRVHVTPLITTLAVNALLIGAMFSYTRGVGTAAPVSLQSATASSPLGVSAIAWIAVLAVLVVAGIAGRTVIGRRFVAVGANPAAARAMGLRADRYVVGAYVAAGILFAFAAVLLVGYNQNPSPTLGNPYLFQTVMAVVIGGTSVAGGRGSVIASAVAALFLTQLGQVVLTLGAGPAMQLLVQAAAMAVALAGAAFLERKGGTGA